MWVDDIRAGLCDPVDNGCKKNVEVPCTAVTTCVSTNGLTQAKTRQCTDGTSAGFYKATASSSWADCGNGTTKNGPCDRLAAVCLRAKLHKTMDDCVNGMVCRTTDAEFCSYKSGDTDCSKM